jgi:osmotically-inducible protein OsmY
VKKPACLTLLLCGVLRTGRVAALGTCLSLWPWMFGLTGCSTGDGHSQSANQRIDDSRTAERVREALAAAPAYRFDGVKVTACDGVVRLNGVVHTGAQKQAAGELAWKVEGVQEVVNNLVLKE